MIDKLPHQQKTLIQHGTMPVSYTHLHIGQIEIYYSTDIGPGFKINHGVGSVIGARAKICLLYTSRCV